jgi:uncharacterized repeat protein (TIGR03803 family)
MARQQIAASIFGINLQARNAGFAALAILALALVIIPSTQAQTFTVLHEFTGGADGYTPHAGIVRDQHGNLYGVAAYGGNYTSSCTYEGTETGCGVVYKLSQHGSGWIFSELSSFDGENGYGPYQLPTVAPDGTLYTTTFWGGPGNCDYFGPGCGIVFHLQPPAKICHSVSCPWTVSDLHQFLGGTSDGAWPEFGSLTMDSAGNLYGTTLGGGWSGNGIVYELSPTADGWTMSVLYNLAGRFDGDGSGPSGGVVFDNAGNLYGVTGQGGAGQVGVIYELTTNGLGWTEHVLHSFNAQTDGQFPSGNPLIDASGNLFGVTSSSGPNGGGTVWELSPGNGAWTFSVLYSFTGPIGGGPLGGLLRDSAGNFYGATIEEGASGHGNVFKLSPSNGSWSYASLYDFTGGSDGEMPYSGLAMDSTGNLFGVTQFAGSSQNCTSGCGTVWEITP